MTQGSMVAMTISVSSFAPLGATRAVPSPPHSGIKRFYHDFATLKDIMSNGSGGRFRCSKMPTAILHVFTALSVAIGLMSVLDRVYPYILAGLFLQLPGTPILKYCLTLS